MFNQGISLGINYNLHLHNVNYLNIFVFVLYENNAFVDFDFTNKHVKSNPHC